MAIPFLLESFEKHKGRGLKAFRSGDLPEAKYNFLLAAQYLLELSRETKDEKLRKIRAGKAMELVELSKNLKEKRKKIREKLSGKDSAPDEASGEDAADDWRVAEKPGIRFDDIAGLEEVKEQIRLKMIYPFLHPEKAKKYRVRSGGGILLYGPPGTGKTMIAKAIAGELDADFFAIAPSEILNKWVGESEKNIRKLFDTARKSERAIIFLDEVEALTPPRRDSESGGVMQRVVPQILNELDGFDRKEGHSLLFLGATNEPWSIDPAMMRPGRLDEKIYLGLPDESARRKILDLNMKEIPVADDVDLDSVARRLEGYSGADIAYLCRKVAETVFEKAIGKDHEPPIRNADFEEVLAKFRPSVSRVDIDRYRSFQAEGS